MLRWSAMFLVFALIAAFFGFGGLAADAAWIAKLLAVIFLAIAAISFLLFDRNGPSHPLTG